MRSFLAIMRDALTCRQAGCSAAVALMTACGNDDDDWETIFERLMKAARLDSRIKKMRPRNV